MPIKILLAIIIVPMFGLSLLVDPPESQTWAWLKNVETGKHEFYTKTVTFREKGKEIR